MKKNYNQPETQVAAMMPQSIICASGDPTITSGGTVGSDLGGGSSLQPVITD